jgi:hypothetical protein
MFVKWSGDHDPPHVHVFKDGRLVLKWNLDTEKPLAGTATPALRAWLRKFRTKGLL